MASDMLRALWFSLRRVFTGAGAVSFDRPRIFSLMLPKMDFRAGAASAGLGSGIVAGSSCVGCVRRMAGGAVFLEGDIVLLS